MAVTNKPRIEAYIGATGSGKGVSINRRLSELQPKRLIIWDPRNEYAQWAPPVTRTDDLVRTVAKAGKGPLRVRYVNDGRTDLAEAFGIVCAVAFRTGDVLLLAEELSDVTKPSWAPPQWKRCITQGRHQAMHIIGAAQRPALIDKTFLGGCTLIRCFALGYDDDRRAMAKELRVPEQALDQLETVEDERTGSTTIRCLERNRRERTLHAVQIKLTKKGGFDEQRAEFGAPAPQEEPAAAPRKRGAT